MNVQRWVIRDPYDTNATTNHYTFPRNPVSMTSVLKERSVSSTVTTAGKVLLYEGSTPAKQWSFSGIILDRAHYDALIEWVYRKKRRLNITDHYGRVITVVFQSMDIVPKRRVNVYWSHDYTITALIINVTPATITDAGPL